MPDLEREDILLRRHCNELVRLLRTHYPKGMKFFEKDYKAIAVDFVDFRIELMNAKLVFALWDSVRLVSFCGTLSQMVAAAVL